MIRIGSSQCQITFLSNSSSSTTTTTNKPTRSSSIQRHLQPNNTILYIIIENVGYICMLSSFSPTVSSKSKTTAEEEDTTTNSIKLTFDPSTFMPLDQLNESTEDKISCMRLNYPTIPIHNIYDNVLTTTTTTTSSPNDKIDTSTNLQFYKKHDVVSLTVPLMELSESTTAAITPTKKNSIYNNCIIIINPCSNMVEPLASIAFTKTLQDENDQQAQQSLENGHDDNNKEEDPRKIQCIKREFNGRVILNHCITTSIIPNSGVATNNDEGALYYQVTSIFPKPSDDILLFYRIYPSTKITLLQPHQHNNSPQPSHLLQQESYSNISKELEHSIISSTTASDNNTTVSSNDVTITTTTSSSEAEHKLKETIQYIEQMRQQQRQSNNNDDPLSVTKEKHVSPVLHSSTNTTTNKEVEAESQLKETIQHIQQNLLPNNSNQNQTKLIPTPLKKQEDDISSEAECKLKDTIQCIRKIHQLQRQKQSFQQFDIPRSFLFHGPPGTGKTYAVKRCIPQNATNIKCIYISGWCDSKTLHDHFQQGLQFIKLDKEENVCILFLDEFDALCSNASNSKADGLLIDLASYLDQMNTPTESLYSNLIVIAATNRIQSIPNYLRRSCRFDVEMMFHPPDVTQRYDILYSLLLEFDGQVQLDQEELWSIAQSCIGYVPADLVNLIRQASSTTLATAKPQLQQNNEEEKGRITMDLLKHVMKGIVPSTLRNKATIHSSSSSSNSDSNTKIKGNINGAKEKILQQAIEWPITKASLYKKLNISIPKGILLFGPPGCGKTSLAKLAAASSGNIAFLSLSPADVYASSYVGEAESIIRNYFTLAKGMQSNVILFFDEIDSILGCSSDSDGGTNDFTSHRSNSIETRMLSTFLNEMDGIDCNSTTNSNVLVLGATNRPHVLDLALLRPGRFDQILFIPPPDYSTRRELFHSFCCNNQSNDIGDDNIAKIDLDYLASDDVSGNMTSAEIISVCQEAAWIALREFKDNTTHDLIVTSLQKSGEGKDDYCSTSPRMEQRHVEEVLSTFVPLLQKEPKYLYEYERFASEYGR